MPAHWSGEGYDYRPKILTLSSLRRMSTGTLIVYSSTKVSPNHFLVRLFLLKIFLMVLSKILTPSSGKRKYSILLLLPYLVFFLIPITFSSNSLATFLGETIEVFWINLLNPPLSSHCIFLPTFLPHSLRYARGMLSS